MKKFKWESSSPRIPDLIIQSRTYVGIKQHKQKKTFWQWLFCKTVQYKSTFVFEILFTNEASNYLKVGDTIQLGPKKWVVRFQHSDIRYTIETITPSEYLLPTIEPGKRVLKLYTAVPEP